MKKLLPLLLATSLLFSACSIDWNDEKDKKIAELENQVIELKTQNETDKVKLDLEREKIDLEKEKRNDDLRRECEKNLDEMHDQRLKILNSCETKECQDKFANSPEFKIIPTYVEDCISLKQ